MEPKKNPKVDVHTKRGLIFNFSLVISLMVIICAFKWTAPIPKGPILPDIRIDDDGITYIPITDFNTDIPDKPKPVKINNPVILPSNPVFVIVKDLPSTEPTANIEQLAQATPAIEVTIEPEAPDTTRWRFVETPPEPIGGFKKFYEELGKNLKYPRRALANSTQGKVFVDFTVEPTGQLSNIKVLKGIGQGCDEEAVRVIALSRWKAGKQRGRPVRVRMVQPVTFALQK